MILMGFSNDFLIMLSLTDMRKKALSGKKTSSKVQKTLTFQRILAHPILNRSFPCRNNTIFSDQWGGFVEGVAENMINQLKGRVKNLCCK